MPSKRHTPERIIQLLRKAEVHQFQGLTIPQACKKNGVHEQTYYDGGRSTAVCESTRRSDYATLGRNITRHAQERVGTWQGLVWQVRVESIWEMSDNISKESRKAGTQSYPVLLHSWFP